MLVLTVAGEAGALTWVTRIKFRPETAWLDGSIPSPQSFMAVFLHILFDAEKLKGGEPGELAGCKSTGKVEA